MSQDNETDAPGISTLIVFITIAILVAIGIIGSVLIILVRPGSTAEFTNTFVLIVGIAISFAGTAGLVNPIAKRVRKVEKQTNGMLSRRDEEIRMLREIIKEMGEKNEQ